MMNSKLYRRNALRKSTPIGVYVLMFKRYWKTLIGTAGTWFLWVAGEARLIADTTLSPFPTACSRRQLYLASFPAPASCASWSESGVAALTRVQPR